MPYLIAIVALILVGLGFTFFRSQSSVETLVPTSVVTEATSSIPTSTAATDTTAVPADDTADHYKDGTYNSQVTYLTPIRSEYKLDVAITLKDNIITNAAVAYSQGAEVDPNAQGFEKVYRTQVIGKDLDTISLSRVGGASLTTGAFNKALAEIKAEAQS